ncbi:MAG TPA: hypothetical protein VFI95_25060 [Terriglobales bacterium]|nr:hypothetical protein [Terriglobales bacterium]
MNAVSNLATRALWQELYLSALRESDRVSVPKRIAQAEQAIVQRARELFNTPGDHIEEEHDLDDALYALHALRTCMRHPRADAA